MTIPNDVKKVLDKLLLELEEDPKKLIDNSGYGGRSDESAYTVQNLETLSCNHLFDDHPGFYGITEQESCILRHFFINYFKSYNVVGDLRKEFPSFFKSPETQDYLDYASGRATPEPSHFFQKHPKPLYQD